MAKLTAEIETMENRFMRAWVQRDLPVIKALTAGNFHLLIGSRPAVMLDRASWIDACTTRFVCDGFRFGDVYVRSVGGVALFASQLELKAKLDGKDWSGRLWVTDMWRKGRVRRRWRLVERVLARSEEDADIPVALGSMQLWRR